MGVGGEGVVSASLGIIPKKNKIFLLLPLLKIFIATPYPSYNRRCHHTFQFRSHLEQSTGHHLITKNMLLNYWSNSDLVLSFNQSKNVRACLFLYFLVKSLFVCCLLLNKTKYKPLFILIWAVQSSPLPSWPTLNQPLCLINSACFYIHFLICSHSLCLLCLLPGWRVSLIKNTLTGSKVKILICSYHSSFL